MKKIIVSAIGLTIIGGAASNGFAVENQMGGYWRTRLYVQDEMAQDGESNFIADNRTRLYYTAKFSDDFKFVNKFEINTVWGDDNGGAVGADGTGIFRIKNSYADWNMGSVNAKLGIQAASIARGFIFDDDFSGAVFTGNFGKMSLPVAYMAVEDEDYTGEKDANMIAMMPTFYVNDSISVTPYGLYYYSDEYTSTAIGDSGTVTTSIDEETNVYYLGLDIDLKMDPATVWGTFIYNGGEIGNADVQGFLAAAGVDAGLVHGQAFYASGDDEDEDYNGFVSAPGQSYYWSEIMGYGIFDNVASNASPNEKITNVAALNAGVTVEPLDKITVTGDVWYAMLAEDDDAGENELGWEFDGKATYAIFDNLTASFVLAYLVAGDATGDENIFEGGIQVSLAY
jgi:hypothetical protein